MGTQAHWIMPYESDHLLQFEYLAPYGNNYDEQILSVGRHKFKPKFK